MTSELTTTAPLTVFVTGATTIVGRALTRMLAAHGHKVIGTASTAEEGLALRADGVLAAYPDLYRAGELRSAIAGTGAQVLVHLAPQAANHPPQAPAHWDLRIAEQAQAVAQAAAEAGIEFIVGTSYVFADTPAGEHGADAKPFLKAVRTAEKALLNGTVPACVLRFGTLYGADSPELASLFSALRLGRPIHPGSAHKTHWLYASDAAAAIMAALTVRPAGQILSIADDNPASPIEFLGYFASSQGLNAPAAAPRFSLRSPFGKVQSALMHMHAEAVPPEGRDVLGWKPAFPSYKHGIDDLLITWRASEAVQA
jgi:2-alkyl-3-oxoalkanoate reductase